jgi:hypothetical protein
MIVICKPVTIALRHCFIEDTIVRAQQTIVEKIIITA